MNRKIIQLATAVAEGETAIIMALCNDGSAWFFNHSYDRVTGGITQFWERVPNVPEDTSNYSEVR